MLAPTASCLNSTSFLRGCQAGISGYNQATSPGRASPDPIARSSAGVSLLWTIAGLYKLSCRFKKLNPSSSRCGINTIRSSPSGWRIGNGIAVVSSTNNTSSPHSFGVVKDSFMVAQNPTLHAPVIEHVPTPNTRSLIRCVPSTIGTYHNHHVISASAVSGGPSNEPRRQRDAFDQSQDATAATQFATSSTPSCLLRAASHLTPSTLAISEL